MKYNRPQDIENPDTIYGKIVSRVKEKSQVLEFGPSGGWMTQYLSKEKDCYIDIVEIDPEGFSQASRFARDGYLGDIEEYGWQGVFQNRKYDYIIMADLLEHLRNPKCLLEICLQYLEKDGEILISTPNIANSNILVNLLHNRFDYTQTGILDNTHIHLFTYDTLQKTIREAGYRPVLIDAVYSDVGDTSREFENNYTLLPAEVARAIANRDNAAVYQFVFIISKKERICEEINLLKRQDVEERFFHNSELYVDVGCGFSEKQKEFSILDRTGARQKVKFSLRQYPDIKQLRWNICQGIQLECRLYDIETDGTNVEIAPVNHDLTVGINDYKFYNQDAVFLITGDLGEASYLEIEFELHPIEPSEAYEYYKKIFYKKENLEETLEAVENQYRDLASKNMDLLSKNMEICQKYDEALKTLNEIYESRSWKFANTIQKPFKKNH
ncbi:hypothetical protein CE91St36_22810 [Christensenellaceae bacterium]|nr:hypothetical protein CE91St36_22810 [Christensenellaceae bacterium]BDF62129.1 hypothetical protein CE91St37_22790 [Christensenellaceae bacterium]